MVFISDFGISERNLFQLHSQLWRELSTGDNQTPPHTPQIFDIGANRGQSLAEYGSQFSQASVYCFEPNPKLTEYIQKVADGLNGVHTTVFPIALGPENGSAQFHEFSDDGVSSFLEPEDFLAPLNTESWVLDSSYSVQIKTIDGMVNEIRSCPDILKIDTQGFDLEVLKGGINALSEGNISIIGVECYFAKNYKGQSYFWDIAKFLETHNYHFHSFTRLVETRRGNIYFGDATFISDKAWKKLGLL